MRVEVDLVLERQVVTEVVEERQFFPLGVLGRLATQVLDDDLRVQLLVDVDGRCGNGEVVGILFVLADPDKLRRHGWVPGVGEPGWPAFVVCDELGKLAGRDIGAVVGVGDRADLLGIALLALRHGLLLHLLHRFDRRSDGLLGGLGVGDLDEGPAAEPAVGVDGGDPPVRRRCDLDLLILGAVSAGG